MYSQYSVLMCLYYKENSKYLEKSIQSILNQTVKTNDFVIVVDGKLTEELDKVIKMYKKKYSDIFNIIQLPQHIGLGMALKIGVEKCKNELIARMDSDDYSIPNRCELQIKKINEDKKIDILGSCIAEFIDTEDNIESYKILPEKNDEIINYAKRRNPFAHPSVMMKKSKVLEAGNYRNYYLCEDYELWIRMIEKKATCYNMQEILVYMRVNDEFYKRRGGIKYLKSIYKFKKEQFKKGFYDFKNYYISLLIHAIVCLIPNFLRKCVYKNLLR